MAYPANQTVKPNLDFTSQTPAEGFVATQHTNDNFIVKNALNAEKFNEYERLFDQISTVLGNLSSSHINDTTIGDSLFELWQEVTSFSAGEMTYYLFAQMFGPGVLPDPEHKDRGEPQAYEFESSNASTSSGIDITLSGGVGVVASDEVNSRIVTVESSLNFDSADIADADEETVGTMNASQTPDLAGWSGGESHVLSSNSITLDNGYLKTDAVTYAGPTVVTCVAVNGGTYYDDVGDFTLDKETGEITGFPVAVGTFLFYYVHFQYRRDLIVLKYGATDPEKVAVNTGTPADTIGATSVSYNTSGELPLYEVLVKPENNIHQWAPVAGAYAVALPDDQIIDLRVGRKDEEGRRILTDGVVSVTQDRFLFNYRPNMNIYVKAFDAIVDGALVRTFPTIVSVPAADGSTRYDAIRVAKDGTVDLLAGTAGSYVVPDPGTDYTVAGVVEVASGATAVSGENMIHMEEVPRNKHSSPNVPWTKDRPLSGFEVQDQSSFTQTVVSNGYVAKPAPTEIASVTISGGKVLINGMMVDVPDMASAYSVDMTAGDWANDYQLIWFGVNKSTLKIDYREQRYDTTERWEALTPFGWESYKMNNGQDAWDNFVPLYVFVAENDGPGSTIGLLADMRDFSPVRRPRIKTGVIWKVEASGQDWTNERVVLRHDLGAADYAVFVQPIGNYPADPGNPAANAYDPVPAVEYVSNNECIIHMDTTLSEDTFKGFRWIAIAESDMIEWGIIKAGYNESTSDKLVVNYADKMYGGDTTYPAVLLSNIYHDDWKKDKALTAYREQFGISRELDGLTARLHNPDENPTPHYIHYAIFPDSLLVSRSNESISIAGGGTQANSTDLDGTDSLDITHIPLAQHYELDTATSNGVMAGVDLRAGTGQKDKLRIVGATGTYNINWFVLREPIAVGRPYGRLDL